MSAREFWLGWGPSFGQGPSWEGPFDRNNAGSQDNASAWATLSFEAGNLQDGDQLRFRTEFTPSDASPVVVDFEDMDYDVDGDLFMGFLKRDGEGWDAPILQGVYKITATVNGIASQNALYLAALGPGTTTGYFSLSWYADNSGETPDPEPEPVGPMKLGWGSSYYVGGSPATTPILASHQGSLSYLSGNWLLGVDQSASALPPGAVVVIDLLFTPADASPALMRQFTGAEVNEDIFFHQNNEWFNPPLYGVYEFTGTCNGVPFLNKLVCTATPEQWGYGLVVYYAEDLEPVAGLFWTAFSKTKEVL